MKFQDLRRFDRLAVNLLCLVPASILAFLYIQGKLGPDPVQILERRTGDIAVALLLLSLIFTPLRIITGFNRGVKYRRITGLYSFYYAAAHFLIFLGLDYAFDFNLVVRTILGNKALWLGSISLLILGTMALTSTDGWKLRLKRNWRRIHRFVYLASLLALLHFALLKKGNLFQLRGEVFFPLLGLIIWAILMLLRLPPFKKWFSRYK
ncbi:MAG: ferric reductase-like transmembrane domain-containing protein [Anaerolineaceae bacterium]|jgi:sulfoxide reductase heme-binding subunit YedZ